MREHCIMYAHQGSPKGLPYFFGIGTGQVYETSRLPYFQSGVGIFLSELSTMLKTMEERFY